MKKRPGPKTAAGWRARAKRYEKAWREIAKRPDYWDEMATELRDRCNRDVSNLKVQIFDLTSAQSRYVRQDNAVRKALAAWTAKSAKPTPTLQAIAKVLDAAT